MGAISFFGILDILAAGILILTSLDILNYWRLVFVFGVYLILKGLAFHKDVASMIDIVIGIYILIALFHPIMLLTVIFSIHLFVKGALSLL